MLTTTTTSAIAHSWTAFCSYPSLSPPLISSFMLASPLAPIPADLGDLKRRVEEAKLVKKHGRMHEVLSKPPTISLECVAIERVWRAR